MCKIRIASVARCIVCTHAHSSTSGLEFSVNMNPLIIMNNFPTLALCMYMYFLMYTLVLCIQPMLITCVMCAQSYYCAGACGLLHNRDAL